MVVLSYAEKRIEKVIAGTTGQNNLAYFQAKLDSKIDPTVGSAKKAMKRSIT